MKQSLCREQWQHTLTHSECYHDQDQDRLHAHCVSRRGKKTCEPHSSPPRLLRHLKDVLYGFSVFVLGSPRVWLAPLFGLLLLPRLQKPTRMILIIVVVGGTVGVYNSILHKRLWWYKRKEKRWERRTKNKKKREKKKRRKREGNEGRGEKTKKTTTTTRLDEEEQHENQQKQQQHLSMSQPRTSTDD